MTIAEANALKPGDVCIFIDKYYPREIGRLIIILELDSIKRTVYRRELPTEYATGPDIKWSDLYWMFHFKLLGRLTKIENLVYGIKDA